jgi:uncharacterized membrane protein YuzA (DUF378 family)
MKALKGILRMVSLVLTWAGGLNWGFYGLSGIFTSPMNLVTYITQGTNFVSNLLFLLVGVGTVYYLVMGHKK